MLFAFAHNTDGLCIETNIRTAITHHFFPKKKKVSDTEVLAILKKVYPKGRARQWYAALMDYGSFLKRSGIRINTKNATYAKQKTFVGSDRQARGALLRALANQSQTRTALIRLGGKDRRTQYHTQLENLVREGFVTQTAGVYHLAR